MNTTHKYKPACNGSGTYDYSIFCEYCGHVAFNANRGDDSVKNQLKAAEPCPRAPQEPPTREDV